MTTTTKTNLVNLGVGLGVTLLVGLSLAGVL